METKSIYLSILSIFSKSRAYDIEIFSSELRRKFINVDLLLLSKIKKILLFLISKNCINRVDIGDQEYVYSITESGIRLFHILGGVDDNEKTSN